MKRSETAEIAWRPNGVPVSTRFDDPYFSLEDGLAETEHVFLSGNALPARFRPGFHIGELGFGTGLNFCTALKAWRRSGCTGPLSYTSFEAFPMAEADRTRALSAFPKIAGEANDLQAVLRGEHVSDINLNLVLGDARETLTDWQGEVNAWFLDGFSPAKNPELWGEQLLRAVAHHTHPRGTAATYSAAGLVRRSLQEAGFTVVKASGFGRKRHMTKAWLG